MMGGGRRLSTLFCIILPFLLLGGGLLVSAYTVTARVGSEAKLPCSYAAHWSRKSSCWGRGPMPRVGCSSQIIASNGYYATSAASWRYRLLGDQRRGDLSLTIRNVRMDDSGDYHCRAMSWYRDDKIFVTLKVLPVRPDPVKLLVKKVTDRTVTVIWIPDFNGGATITNYIIEIKEKQQLWDNAKRSEVHASDKNELVLMGLRPATAYYLRAYAFNVAGWSDVSNIDSTTTREAPPDGPPLDLKLEKLSPHAIAVSWKLPQPQLRNGKITRYTLNYRPVNQTGQPIDIWHRRILLVTADNNRWNVTGLRPSTKYEVKVQAATAEGWGPKTTAFVMLEKATSTEPPGVNSTAAPEIFTQDVNDTFSEESTTTAAELTGVPPDPPVLVLKEVEGNSITIVWTPAAFQGDTPITGFYLESKTTNASWDDGKIVVEFSANDTEATLSELIAATYEFRLFARNTARTSNASNVLSVTAAEEFPVSADIVTPVAANAEALASASVDHTNVMLGIIVPVILTMLVLGTLAGWKVKRRMAEREDPSVSDTGALMSFQSLQSEDDL